MPSYIRGNDAYDSATAVKTTGAPGTLNASGSAPIYACRAWVNFDGTGTVAIRGSGNVSSITDNGVGRYTINFTIAMSDANYVLAGTAKYNDTTQDNSVISPITYNTNSLLVYTAGNASGYIGSSTDGDCLYVNATIFR